LPGPISSRTVVQEGRRGRPRQRERTARVNVRATARTNGGKLAQTAIPGTSSKPTNPSACGTQVKICFRGRSGSAAFDVELGLPRVSFPFERRAGPLYGVCEGVIRGARMHNMRAPRARLFRPAFRTPRWGEGTGPRRRAPRRDQNRGDDARLQTSVGLFDI
jgi:hypothetical protein